MERYIVVGVDGSPSSIEAARWAAKEAALRVRPVLLLHAFTGSGFAAVAGLWPFPTASTLHQAALDALETGRHAVKEVSPEVEVETEVAGGHPAGVLTRASRAAELIVVGTRGLGGLPGLALGSVALQVALGAHCPVVVARPGRDEGPVVVGVDLSEPTEPVLQAAFNEAFLRGAPLLGVHVREPVRLATGDAHLPPEDQDDERVLAMAMRGWAGDHPVSRLEAQVRYGSPAAALTEASRTAQLLVVGARGRSATAHLLLGSTTHALLQSAGCPVLVVPVGATVRH